MQFIPRLVTPQLEALMPEKQVLVITGMRRVGKTTQLKHLFEQVQSTNKLMVNLEDALTRKIFQELNYQNIKRSLEQEGIRFDEPSVIFIDEVQFVPEITSVIKYLYDEYSVKFVVSGSSSYYLKNHFTESLSGRKFVVELHPLTFAEFLQFKGITKTHTPEFTQKAHSKLAHDEDKYLQLYQEYMSFGGFPDVVLNPKAELKKEILRDIINSYFQIDVTSLAEFGDIAALRDLLILLTQRIGSKLNITNLATALGIKRQKVYEYLEFLKSTYVIATLPQHSSTDNQVSADEKCYFTDTGLASILGEISSGSRFENSVYMNLAYSGPLTYHQSSSQKEIDFVIQGTTAIEVKETPSLQDVSNLKKRAQALGITEQTYLVSLHHQDIAELVMAWDL